MKKVFSDYFRNNKKFIFDSKSKLWHGNGGSKRVFSGISGDTVITGVMSGTAIFLSGCVIGSSLVVKKEEEKSKD